MWLECSRISFLIVCLVLEGAIYMPKDLLPLPLSLTILI